MKKLLGILLVLALTVGAFSGLTLFSMSAGAAGSYANDSEFFIDFENESDQATYGVNGTFVSADDLAAAGVPTTTPTGKKLGNVVKFVGVNRWDGLSLPASIVDPVITASGWYVVSAWVYCESWTDSDGGQKIKVNLAHSGAGINSASNYITSAGAINKSIGLGNWCYFEEVVYLEDAWYTAARENARTFSFRFDSWGLNPYYVDDIKFARVDGTNYSLVRIGDMESSSMGAVFKGANFPLNANNTPVIKIYNLNSAVSQFKTRIGTGWSGAGGSNQDFFLPANSAYTITTKRAFSADEIAAWPTSGSLFYQTLYYNKTSATATSPMVTASAGIGWRFALDITHFTPAQSTANEAFLTTAVNRAVMKNVGNTGLFVNSDVARGNVWYYANAEGMYTAKATAYSGYAFSGWYDSLGRLVSSDATITTYGAKALTAKFVDPNYVPPTVDFDALEKNFISDDLSNFDALEVGATVALGSVGGATNFTVTEDAEKGKVVTYTAPATYGSAGWSLGEQLRALDAALGGGKTIRISISVDFKTTAARDFTEISFRNTAKGQILSSGYGYKHVIGSNAWHTLTWVLDVTPELLGSSDMLLCFDRVSTNAVISIDNVVVKYVPTPQNERVLEVEGDGVTINGVAESAVRASEGNIYKIALNDATKVLVGVKYADGTTVIPAVNGVVDFVMPNSDVTLELITQDVSFVPEKNEITIIAGNGTIIKTVENATDIPAAPARLGYTIAGYSVNGAATVATLEEAQAAAQALLDAGTKQIAVKYVYTKNSTDKTVISVNGEKSTVEKLKLVTFSTPAVKEGVPFAYWEDANGNIVSYNRILAVYPTSNLYVTAVYAAEVVKEDYFELTGFTKNADQSISLVSNRNMGTSTLVKHGLRLVSSLKQLSEADAKSVLGLGDVLGGTKRYTVWAGATNPVGTFVASKTSADSNLFWYAAAIYKVEGGADYVISNYKELTPNQVESALATFDDVDSVDQLVALGILSAPTGERYTSEIAEEDGNKFLKMSFAAGSNTWSAPALSNFKDYFTEAGTYTFSVRAKIVSTGETEVGNFGMKLVGADSLCTGVQWSNDTTGTYKTDFFNGCNNPASTGNVQVYRDVAGNIAATSEWATLSYTWTITDADLETFVGQDWSLTFHMLNKNAHDLCIDDITIVKGENVNF
ncbi:MAG: hypothetical protein IKB86_02600 [Clostridia bacterium]|nr:hypothetical protein [Clostridia bacterium]